MLIRKLFGLAVASALAGALLAFAAPLRSVTADTGKCKCDDWGSGDYQCNFAQTQCVAGHESCNTLCS
jgi:hypothetical protein